MQNCKFIDGYTSAISFRETERAIKTVKDEFQTALSRALELERVSAPVIVKSGTGINDDLNGSERPVRFDVKAAGCDAEIVHSLAKWKRAALMRYGFQPGEGLYTDMNALRRDDLLDNKHSIYVDQWDWERVITREQRNLDYLKNAVKKIAAAVSWVKNSVNAKYPALKSKLSPDVFFITSEELLQKYPDDPASVREYKIVKEHKTVFLIGIGGKLSNGKAHDGRAPDYDDWSLNGDLLYYDELLDEQMEISSMGIRVDEASLVAQLKEAGAEDRLKYDFHRGIIEGTLPLTMGGGIGQSRLCMLILEKLHIGEVQSSVWTDEILNFYASRGVRFL